MKQKIKEALQQAYKNLGLNEEVFEGVATFGETLGINEETLANFVKGAEWQLKKMQSDADKMRNATVANNKQVEELKAQLAAAEAKIKTDGEGSKGEKGLPTDLAEIVKNAVAEATVSFKEELATIKASKAAEDAFNVAKSNFFDNDYAKKYDWERDQAWERAIEVNELSGNKMTADELQAKAMGYFKTLVAKKGEDISKPFKSEGSPSDTPDFSEDVKILEKEGLLKTNQK